MARLLSPFLLFVVCVLFALAQVPEAEAAKKKKDKGGKHAHIHAAVKALERAKHDLEIAAHDFGGHRASAIGAIDVAIVELNKALEFADKKGTKKKKKKN